MTYARESLTDRWPRLSPQQRATVIADLERWERPRPRRPARMATAAKRRPAPSETSSTTKHDQ